MSGSVKKTTGKSIDKAMQLVPPLFVLSSALLLSACGGGGGGGVSSGPGILLSKTTASTSEDVTEDTFGVVLGSAPTSDVEITFKSRDLTEGSIGSDTDKDWGFDYFGETVDFTFTPANWNVPQTIKVQGKADGEVDGNQTYNVAVTWIWSMDLNYIGLTQPSVSVTNIDTSAPGITVTNTSLTTAENGSGASFSVNLNVAPTGTVTIPVTISDASEGSFSSYSSVTEEILTFDQNNWDYPQSVYVADIDDDIADGNQTYSITVGASTSADPSYNGLTGDTVSVTNTDNDTAAYTVNAAGTLQTTEWGQTANFTVVLNTEPTANVVIPVTSPDTTEGLMSSVAIPTPAVAINLTFTTANWQTPQVVTVNPEDDANQDGDINYNISVGAPTGASEFTTLPAQSVAVVNVDDDTPRVTIQGADLQTTEDAGTDTFVVSLAKAPSGNVVIDITSGDTTEGRVKGGNSPTTAADTIKLTFTPIDWQTSQTVTVVGQDDFEIDANQSYTVNVAIDQVLTLDAGYDALSAQSVSVTNADNDVAGLTTADYASVTEGGATDFFTVKLNTMPAADVVVPVSVEDPNEFLISANGVDFASSFNLTFTTANWSTPQTVTVGAEDDFVDEYSEYFDVTMGPATSADVNYDGLPAKLKSITIYDNDSAGFAITPSTGLATTEGGTSDSFTVALTSEPVANVFVTVSAGNITEGLLTGGTSPATQVDVVTLEFTPSDWQGAQTVTVHGQDDAVLDGPIAYDLTVAVIDGTDTRYNSVSDEKVGVTNSDNEPTNAEGTDVTPVDITSLLAYSGLVDTTASYYVITGLTVAGSYDFSASSVIDDISLHVYSNSNFNSGLLCSSVTAGTKTDESCRATTSSGTVYIMIDGALTGNGASFVLDAKPVYTIETFPNGSAENVDTIIELYQASNLSSYELRDDDGGSGTYSKITTGLSAGETYYLKVEGYSSSSTGAYSVWFTSTATSPTSAVVPTDGEGEPGDNTSAGATLLTADTVVDRTITTSDVDWFVFTVPTP